MITRFNRLIDFFIHPRLKADNSNYEKSRISVIAFVIVLFIISLYELFYFSKGYYFNVKALHNYLGISATTAALLLIKITGKRILALSLIAGLGVYLVSASVYMSGGINSNDILWYVVLSTASFMFIGIKTGFIISVLSFLGISFFYLFEAFGFVYFYADAVSLSLEYRYFNFVLILAVLIFMVYALTRSNIKLQDIVQLNKEQNVRENIARDFHDQIGNKLASLRHLAALTNQNKSEAEKADIIRKIDINAKDVYENFKDFIWTEDPKSDQLQEVFMYLRDFADNHLKHSEINLFITTLPEELPAVVLPPNWSKEIVPLFKEAFTNAYKHAAARNIHFYFSFQNNTLEIRLKDDGQGIKEGIASQGKGLRNMHHRANELSAQLTFNAVSPSGTEVVFSAALPVYGSNG